MPLVDSEEEVDRKVYDFESIIVDTGEGLARKSPYQYASEDSLKDKPALIVWGGKKNKAEFDKSLDDLISSPLGLANLEILLAARYCVMKTENANKLKERF